MPFQLQNEEQRRMVSEGFRDMALVIGAERRMQRDVILAHLQEDEVDVPRMARMILQLGIYCDVLLVHTADREGIDREQHLRTFLAVLERKARSAEEGTAEDWQLEW